MKENKILYLNKKKWNAESNKKLTHFALSNALNEEVYYYL